MSGSNICPKKKYVESLHWCIDQAVGAGGFKLNVVGPKVPISIIPSPDDYTSYNIG